MYGDGDKDDEEKTNEQEQETDKGELIESKRQEKSSKKRSTKIEAAENGIASLGGKKRKRCNGCKEYKDQSEFGTK